MRIVIIGSRGMLGQAFCRVAQARGYEVIGFGRSNTVVCGDLTDDQKVAELFKKSCPDLVVNCAAIINIEECNVDPLQAWRVNARGVGILSNLCRLYGAKFVQISTDHYYCDEGRFAHNEQAPLKFFNEYGRTKFAGEAFALTFDRSLVLRTNIIGFRGNKNLTMAEWAFDAVENDREVTLFEDSFVSSIDTESFAKATLDLVSLGCTGLVNLASSEVFSKRELIEMIASELGCHLTRATIGTVRDLKVERADSCGLDVRKAESILGYKLPTLQETVSRLVKIR
ncbi:SDR family oxidoreductase [Akkermansiaceae bacterium]|nr:SDR family oxidoreductase [Akkermansiaceae bacterium]